MKKAGPRGPAFFLLNTGDGDEMPPVSGQFWFQLDRKTQPEAGKPDPARQVDHTRSGKTPTCNQCMQGFFIFRCPEYVKALLNNRLSDKYGLSLE